VFSLLYILREPHLRASVVVKGLDKDKDLMSKDKEKESSFKDKDKDL